MFSLIRTVFTLIHGVLDLAYGTLRLLISLIVFNPHLGPFRYITNTLFGFCLFALFLVYIFAPLRGWAGSYWMGPEIHYASERWLGTALYDQDGHFIGTFDPNMDSKRDLNTTGKPILVDNPAYTANPDHKSISVRTVPDHFWQCLTFHEDRNLGGLLNPFGIDLFGVFKIPLSTIERSIKAKSFQFGVGGSTLPMQLVRVYNAAAPSPKETGFEKMRRKLLEWWDAPVFYWELTRGGNHELLKQWAANHLWLAHRTGGQDLQGIELTSRIIFGKPASELTIAEQYVLASAVNKPIILLEGSDQLNKVRLDRWRYVTETRAKTCATKLLQNDKEKKNVIVELSLLASGPLNAKIQPHLAATIEKHHPNLSKVASANPVARANLLTPAVRYAAREEMKQVYGFNWRHYVRGVEITLDVNKNLTLRKKIWQRLEQLNKKYKTKIDPSYTLSRQKIAAQTGNETTMPDVIIVAATPKGEIIRYFESNDIAAYYGAPYARSRENGRYEPEQEIRAIASIGKIMAAIALANQGRDTLHSPYQDKYAPKATSQKAREACRRGDGTTPGPRRAEVAFACSLNTPLEWRMARYGQKGAGRLINQLGLTMPYAPDEKSKTPPSTAIVRGLVTAAPRKIHQLSTMILARLTGKGAAPVPLPYTVRNFQKTGLQNPYEANQITSQLAANTDLLPNSIIRSYAQTRLRQFLQSPLCFHDGKKRRGTLKSLSNWCAARRKDVTLHFAKTGTQVTNDPDATVDTWLTGGIEFSNGKAYSYVVVIGTGNRNRAFARKLHAADLAAPVLETLLKDLRSDAFNGNIVKTSGVH